METEVFIISTSLFTGGAERQAIWLANYLSQSSYKVNLLILKKGDELSHLVDGKVKISRFQIYSADSQMIFKYIRLARLAIRTAFKINSMIKKSDKKNKVIISYMFHSYVFGYFTKIFNPKIKLIYSVRSDRLGRRTSRKSKTRHLIFKLISKKATRSFSIDLFGFDGVKKETFKVFNSSKIFATVDKMPMSKVLNLSLFSDYNPKTTTYGLGFKDKNKALFTIKAIKNKNLKYQVNVISTMLGRAKKHPHKTKNMRDAIRIFSLWMKNYKNNRRT